MPQSPNSRTRAVRVIMSAVKVLWQGVQVSDHEPDPHASDDGAHDAHDAHATQALGPIDWRAWLMAVVGGALAVVVAVALVLAAHPQA